MTRIASVPLSRRALLATVPALAALPEARSRAASPPSFVVIVTDDMRASDWRALPKARALPGAWFPNFIATTPLCCPSRASILTGMYAHNHRVLTNQTATGGGYPAFQAGDLADDTIAARLRQAGYRTGLVGKFLNDYQGRGIPAGWDAWYANVQNNHPYTEFTINRNGTLRQYPAQRAGAGDRVKRRRDPGRGDRDHAGKHRQRRVRTRERRAERRAQRRADRAYITDVQARQAVRFLAATPADQPLFLYLGVKAPHSPWRAETVARRHRDAFRGQGVGHGASVNEADVADKPRHIRTRPTMNPRALHRDERIRLRSLLAVDDAIMAVVRELERSGRMDSTFIFVLSDHGHQMGHHRWHSKGVPYDQTVRVPLLVIGPGFGAGTDERLVATIDLAPTIAGLAGVRLPRADGASLLASDRDAVLIERFPGNEPGPPFQAVRTITQPGNYLYVEYETGERELYSYEDDPNELKNGLAPGADNPPDPGLVAALAARLDELRDE